MPFLLKASACLKNLSAVSSSPKPIGHPGTLLYKVARLAYAEPPKALSSILRACSNDAFASLA